MNIYRASSYYFFFGYGVSQRVMSIFIGVTSLYGAKRMGWSRLDPYFFLDLAFRKYFYFLYCKDSYKHFFLAKPELFSITLKIPAMVIIFNDICKFRVRNSIWPSGSMARNAPRDFPPTSCSWFRRSSFLLKSSWHFFLPTSPAIPPQTT